jgi:hypothetical protein
MVKVIEKSDFSVESVKRFFDSILPVTESGCWIWDKHINKDGYGVYGANNKQYLAHRVSYTFHVGDIPNNFHVLHKCDVPSCVNPSHLFVGNDKDNMVDKKNKGRTNIGSKHPSAKTNEKEVKQIKLLLNKGYSNSYIMNKYGLSKQIISNIKNKRTWGHVNVS